MHYKFGEDRSAKFVNTDKTELTLIITGRSHSYTSYCICYGLDEVQSRLEQIKKQLIAGRYTALVREGRRRSISDGKCTKLCNFEILTKKGHWYPELEPEKNTGRDDTCYWYDKHNK